MSHQLIVSQMVLFMIKNLEEICSCLLDQRTCLSRRNKN